jgi:dephospho-CoA kinase
LDKKYMPTLILGLTGQIGSGKGYVCDYLVTHYGAQMFKFSTYLSRAIEVMALENSRDNLIRMSEALRKAFGEDALSYALAHDASKSSAPIAVIDGIRRAEDLVALTPLANFMLAAVDADPTVRYARIANRGEKAEESSLSWEDFLEQEQRSTEITVPKTMAMATVHLDNNAGTAELEAQIDALMARFGITKL